MKTDDRGATLPFALPDQHPRLAGGGSPRAWPVGHSGGYRPGNDRRLRAPGLRPIWLLSVWQTGPAGRAVSRGNAAWRAGVPGSTSDLTEDDICGSGFAITGYTVSEELGGDQALSDFRGKLAQHGIRLMLDSCRTTRRSTIRGPPSTLTITFKAARHCWPLRRKNYIRVETPQGPRILAHGRDPNFPGWPDTLQLDYANPDLQRAKLDELLAVAGKCDGVRCDMAMLLLPEIFQRTWGVTPELFWPKATAAGDGRMPASPSWPKSIGISNDAQQGFDYCYDKRLYDRLQAATLPPCATT
jgi:hypothetical protein